MRHTWTGTELRYLESRYPNLRTAVIAAYLEVSISAVFQKAYALGLRKSDAFLNSNRSGRFDKFSESSKRHRFAKGNIPPNKGQRMPEHIKEKVKHTWFKKGQIPHNTKYDGYISIRNDKSGRPYAHIRIAQGKFDLLHRHIWQMHYGQVPEGKIIVFKNGDPSDFRIENLELITREENMLRNTRHNYPPDLQQAIMALNKLKKSIKEYGKE